MRTILKYKIILFSLLTGSMAAPAYCQGIPVPHQIKIINGTVANVDAVGNVITIQTEDQKQMAFSVPDKTSITQETREIGLMDVRATDPVVIQYYISSSGKYTVVSIMDNKAAASP